MTFFERSRAFFEDNPDCYMTAGYLAKSASKDPVLALKYVEEAVSLPEFPYSVGRSYGRLLIEAGESEAARSFLISWLPRLRNETFEARTIEIQNWIHELESDLDIPTSN